jgi:tRNA threonylcarbamoyl adenosine modification protein YeaZ
VLVLALDTATPSVTAGVVEFARDRSPHTLGQRVTVDARAHGELLTPHLKDALAQASLRLSDLDAIVCGVGPGPFTGLRAGMVTAAALGHSLDIPVHPVCTLDAIAVDAAAVDAVQGEPLLVATDARRREVYWAAYDAHGTRVEGPHVERPADVVTKLAGLGVTRAAGQGAELYREVWGLPVVGPSAPAPAGLVAAASADLLDGTAPDALTPLYLRRPDAVEPTARKRVSR